MRVDGTLVSWHDDRGFGFIEPRQGGDTLFVRIADFPAGTGRPRSGLVLSFEVRTRADGRKRAHAVRIAPQAHGSAPGPEGRIRRGSDSARGRGGPGHRGRVATGAGGATAWPVAHAAALPLFAVLLGAVQWQWGLSVPVVLACAALSLFTMLVYALDKSAAQAGRRRTPEAHLHLLALAGGWPGALLAQQWLRHKNRKPGFQAVFWATVLLHGAGLLACHAGWLHATLAPR